MINTNAVAAWLCAAVILALAPACDDTSSPAPAGGGGGSAPTGGSASGAGGIGGEMSSDGGGGGSPAAGGGSTGGAGPGCGDGEVGPGEACDDGNAVNGDGCSDCMESGSVLAYFELSGPAESELNSLAWAGPDRLAATGVIRDAQGALDILVVVFEVSTAQVLWSDTYNGVGAPENEGGSTDRGTGVVALPDGSLVVSGYELVSDPALVPYPRECIWARRYSADGSVLWTKQMPTTDIGRAGTVSANDDGRIFVGGSTESTAWLRAYNQNGAEMWTEQPPGTGPGGNGGNRISGIATTVDSRVAVVGALRGASNASEYYVALFNNDGDEVWSEVSDVGQYGGRIGAAEDGTLFTTGTAATSGFLRKYSSSGDLQWHLDSPLGAMRLPNVMSVWASGDVLLGTNFWNGTSDVPELTRLDSEGGVRWAREIDPGTLSYRHISASAIAPDGRIAVGGRGDPDSAFLAERGWAAVIAQ